MSKIKLNLLFQVWVSVSVVSIDICYCEKLFLSFISFQSFPLFCCNKVIFVLMFGTQYYFCSMFYVENWIVVRVKLTMRFLWRCNFAIDCAVKMLLWECTWCFLYILVFAFICSKPWKFLLLQKAIEEM